MHLIGCLSLHCFIVFLELWSVLSFGPYIFFVSGACYIIRGRALGILQGGATHIAVFWCCMCGKGLRGNNFPLRGNFEPLVQLSASFHSLLPLPTSKLGPSGADFQWVVLCTFYNPVALSNELSFEAGSFSRCLLNPHGCFQSEVWGFISPTLEPWVARSTLLPCHSSQFIYVWMWGLRVCQPPPCQDSSLPSCPSLPLLPVWMNVSCLSPWLLDFHTVWFSVSSGCFLFLNCCCPSFDCARGTVCLSMSPSLPEVL